MPGYYKEAKKIGTEDSMDMKKKMPSEMVMEIFANLPKKQLVTILADLVTTHASQDEYYKDSSGSLSSLGFIGNALEYALDKIWFDDTDKLQKYIDSIKGDAKYWVSEVDIESSPVFYIDVGNLGDAKSEEFIRKVKEMFAKNKERTTNDCGVKCQCGKDCGGWCYGEEPLY